MRTFGNLTRAEARGRVAVVAAAAALLMIPVAASAQDAAPAIGTTPGIVNKGLVAVGRLPANLRDKFGETFGSGSGMALDPAAWKRNGDSYEGEIWLLPDRGYNVEGTTNYRPRVNRLSVTLAPVTGAATGHAGEMQSSLKTKLVDTILLKDAAGADLTGLDPGAGTRPAAGAMPMLPQADNGLVSLDAEAIVRLADGTLLISDEYGPYIYRFAADGRMLSATPPPRALLPMRKGKEHFASNNPGPGAKAPEPANPETGRQNNQGLEGMALTPSGRFLVTVLQSAARQDGGDNAATRRYTRAMVYDAADPANLKLVREHVVPLPEFKDEQGRTRVAAQSELVALSDTLFLLLCRDSGNGYGLKGDTSLYRRIEILDLANATNIAGTDYDGLKPIAPKGVLEAGIVPAKLTSFIDINDASQLSRFGLRNGKPNDRMNLSEKWEAMALASVLDSANPQEFFLFVINDNDFMTQDGFQVGEAYKDAGGADVDTLFLVYRVQFPMLATK